MPAPGDAHSFISKLIEVYRMSKILMVLTSHNTLGNTGRPTGFWLEEFTAPYYVFLDAGEQITVASPKGGQPPIDPKSDEPGNQTDSMTRFKGDKAAQAVLASTVKLSDMKASDFDTVFYSGGHGPMWDLAEDPVSIALIESWENSLSALQRRVFWYYQARLRWTGQTPPANTAELLTKIEANIAGEEPVVQWAMNFTAGWIGVYEKQFRGRCISIGEKTGLYKGEKVSKGCTPGYLPEFIAIESNKRNL